MSNYVYHGWAVQLIEANPYLTLLDWTYPDEGEQSHHRCKSSQSKELEFSKDLMCITGLRKPASLRLKG